MTAIATQKTDFEVIPLNDALGAEIRGIDLRHIDDDTFKRLYEAYLFHVLLVVKNQSLNADDLVKLCKRFGPPVSSSNLHKRDLKERTANTLFNLPPEITVVTNLKEDGKPVGILGDGELVWHSDFSFTERPTAARMLMGIELPPEEKGGSHTTFLNAYAAYDALPADYKRTLSGKTIKQGNIIDTALKLRPGVSLDDDIRTAPGASHPVISTHPETGANLLFLGRRHAAYVNGLPLADSENFLEDLWARGVQERFYYTHHWQQGDFVVWDNRAVIHRRDAFDPATRRVLYAAQVEGHKPYEAPDALSRPSHGRAKLTA
jgi:taurine dioxygenase